MADEVKIDGNSTTKTIVIAAVAALLGAGGAGLTVDKLGVIHPTQEITASEKVVDAHTQIISADLDTNGDTINGAQTINVPRRVELPSVSLPENGWIVLKTGCEANIIVSYTTDTGNVVIKYNYKPEDSIVTEMGNIGIKVKIDSYQLNGVVTR